jgi:CheY-like chemotaxis protein/HPt (histidine-containing phosphotransfer) domain-containing protein
MAQAEDPSDELEKRLAEIRARFIAGLSTRAKSFRATADGMAAGKPEARGMARELMHRLSGVAGTHGLSAIGNQARACEDAIVEGAPTKEIIASLLAVAQACDATAEGATQPPKRPSDSPQIAVVIPSDDSRPEVLVVEDDPSTARWICVALERVAHVTPIHVGTGSEARDLLAARTFALVILDGMLPGATGLELLAEIRGETRHGETRVMMLSASHKQILRSNALLSENDADAWLTKPVPLETLARVVARLLGRA